jgi:hypothetical protein
MVGFMKRGEKLPGEEILFGFGREPDGWETKPKRWTPEDCEITVSAVKQF